METIITQIQQKAAAAENDILTFFREIVAIPSMDSDIEAVGERVGAEMRKLGYDKVYVDKYGSIVGKIGDGEKILLLRHPPRHRGHRRSRAVGMGSLHRQGRRWHVICP
ncbi:MAG: hypothetical protein M5U34_26810 [Chloroflexi bacterium]|nr:hypothetical protein [Chloroflexota bacterium]